MLEASLFAVGIGLLVTLNTLRLYRKTNYLKELIRRQNGEQFAIYNKLVKNLSESFSQGPKPTLKDLAADIDRKFEVK